jgi:hypothetical protein
MPVPRDMQPAVPQIYLLTPAVYNLYTNEALERPVFIHHHSIYTADSKEGCVRNLHNDINPVETWCKRWKVEIDYHMTHAIYLCHVKRLMLSSQEMDAVPFYVKENISF